MLTIILVANYAPVVSLMRDDAGHLSGAVVEADGDRFDVRARVIVNACGIWSDRVRAMDDRGTAPSIRPARDGAPASGCWPPPRRKRARAAAR